MTTLQQRLLTSLVLIPLVIVAIYQLPAGWFASICLGLMLWAALEWSWLIERSSRGLQVIFLCTVLFSTVLSTVLWAIHLYSWVALGFWLLMFFIIYQYPASKRWWSGTLSLWGMGVLAFALAWTALVEIRFRAFGADLILYLLLLVWAADIGAYVAGNLYGKHKLIPQVSPGKTIEGVMGGMVASLIVAVIVKGWILSPLGWPAWLALALITSIASIVGDLFISMVKRYAGVKDSGRLLPGHGGLLDRIDSLLAAAPVFVLVYGWLHG